MESNVQMSWNILLNKLEQMGFYQYTKDNLIEKAKAETIKTGWLYPTETKRAYFADSEELAEGGVKEFILQIKLFLESQNIVIHEIKESFEIGGGYSLTIDNNYYTIYTEDELEKEELWELTTKRTFNIINNILNKVGSKERIYLLYGGNDSQGVFLTKELYKVIMESNFIKINEKPVEMLETEI